MFYFFSLYLFLIVIDLLILEIIPQKTPHKNSKYFGFCNKNQGF
tara:strand:- start:463 stop:594 length:132 start_codon:yes stop_codon:yes gene_type:complete